MIPVESTIPPSRNLFTYSQAFASLGALGVALQNYPAVSLFINGLTTGVIPASRALDWSIQIAAFSMGGLCSGMVNFWMNVELLNGFFNRMTADNEYQYKQLTAWQQLQYFSGIFVFVVTGILFGLMAFTFAMEGPLAMLSIVAGVFVAGIMTIQEVETWLSGYDEKEATDVEIALTHHQLIGKWIGHIIAAGNVLALSLLFTLSLTQALMTMHMAALPALIIGFSVAFTFGAFTEYYFYNAYLSEFCKNFGENWTKMMAISHAWVGVLCVSTNAFVNGALTYAGVELLTGVLLAANLSLPPIAAMTALAVVSAFFAGSASLMLGLDFWIRQNPVTPSAPQTPSISLATRGLSVFSAPAANADRFSAADQEFEAVASARLGGRAE
ncbi:MAG: hypothetical protein CK424_08640 [Legionella sp.]|nr:MAG: hypothetical protein CK424_08640 [Legionella sp.]